MHIVEYHLPSSIVDTDKATIAWATENDGEGSGTKPDVKDFRGGPDVPYALQREGLPNHEPVRLPKFDPVPASSASPQHRMAMRLHFELAQTNDDMEASSGAE